MSVKPKPGGAVRICNKNYDVIEGPVHIGGGYYSLVVRSQADGGGYRAQSRSSYQQGCGPWKIVEPLVEVA